MMEHVEYTTYPPDFEFESTMSIAASISCCTGTKLGRNPEMCSVAKGRPDLMCF